MSRFLIVLSTLLAVLVMVTDARREASDDPDRLAIVGATVVPMDSERVLRNHTVLVEGDRIVAVGPTAEVEIPEEAKVVDGTGRFVIPGLAEMHGHIPSPQQSQEFIDDVLFLYVANGVTTVRGMLGFDGQLALKDRVLSGEAVGPTLYLAGPSFNGGSVSSAEEAERKVRKQAEEGWDLLKIHPGVPLEAYERMAETARELGMRFAGHVPEEVGLLHALEMGQETFDHIDGYTAFLRSAERDVTDEELRDISKKTQEAGAWVVPTMALWETLWGTADLEVLSSYDELKYMPSAMVDGWKNNVRRRAGQTNPEAAGRVIETRMRLLKVMQEEGVGILFGTDAPQLFSVPGFSVHREVTRMVDAGLTPYEILVSATRNVGDYFANEDRFGTLAEGQRADMLVLEADPLADISNLKDRAGVVLRGHWLPESEIQERLEAM
ncbi:MAG: amidohydrolase family protein, partial [Rhodothermales bacterium]|nr:amidohydrolase family protein [Rhodothermales bacterium]